MVFFTKYKLVKMTNNDGIFYVHVQCCVQSCLCSITCKAHNSVGLHHIKKHRLISVTNISCDSGKQCRFIK